MLFKFSFFWQATLLMLFFWLIYGVWGFEFTVITLLVSILASIIKKSSFL